MKLIPKAAVLAGIDKVMAEEMKFYETACKEGDEEVSSSPMVYTRLQILRSCIDTLEVKEVDLEKIISDWLFEGLPNDDELIDYIKETAKHFFELGLCSTITEEDCKLIWNIGDEIPYMPEEEFFKELLKQYKAQKGK